MLRQSGQKWRYFDESDFFPRFSNKKFDRVWWGGYTPASQHGAAWSASRAVLVFRARFGRYVPPATFFDIVFTRRDAWAAVMLLGLVSDIIRTVTYSILTCTIAYPGTCLRMCEPCRFWVTGSCLSCLGLLSLIWNSNLRV